MIKSSLRLKNIAALFLTLSVLFCSQIGRAVVRQNPLNFKGAGEASVGIYIEDLSTGEVLYDVNGLTPLIPASITKALTSASILTMRDSSFRYATDVSIDGVVKGSVLKGNIVIHAVGDPSIESSHFKNTSGFADSIANALISLGINKVEGTVVIDESAVPYDAEPRGWMDEDIVWPYGAGHYGANYHDNKFVLSFPSQKSDPYVPDLKINLTPANRSLSVSRKRGSTVIEAKGTPRKKGESITVSIPKPSSVMRHEIMQAIINNDIEVSDKPLDNNASKGIVIYTYLSPTLGEMLQSLMFRSDNMMAESMLRLLAPGKSRVDAVKTEMNMWELRNIDTEEIVIEDGSGLSRNDRLTPYFLADVFAWMTSHVKAKEYADLFPQAGKNGTMKNFLKDTPLEGKVAMKTGSMKKVQCYAGFLLGDDGLPTHVLIFMINNFSCDRTQVVKSVENLLLQTFAPEYTPTPPTPVKQTTKKTGAKRKR